MVATAAPELVVSVGPRKVARAVRQLIMKFQFRLRTLMIVVTLLAVPLG